MGSVTTSIVTDPVTVAASITGVGALTPTTSGGRTFYTFTGSGSFTISPSSGNIACEILVVGGGGGGGFWAGGGGGGGTLVLAQGTLPGGTYSVTVGAGGAGGTYSTLTDPTNGSNSTFGSYITAPGGGGGGSYSGNRGKDGGSGGGGSELIVGSINYYLGGAAGVGTITGPFSGGILQNLASAGGQGQSNIGSSGGAGGGGAGGAGSNVPEHTSGGANGGVGLIYTTTGNYYAGGGGGGSAGTFWADNGYPSSYTGVGIGGSGGGGNGAVGTGEVPVTAPAGTANTGGGGGGAGYGTGGAGGSGIVIVSYVTTAPTSTTSSAIVAVDISASNAWVSGVQPSYLNYPFISSSITGSAQTWTLTTTFRTPSGPYSGSTATLYYGYVPATYALTGTVTTLATGFNVAAGVAVRPNGSLVVCSFGTNSHVVQSVTRVGAVSLLAGNGPFGFVDNVTGAAAKFNTPYGVAAHPDGNVFVADAVNSRIRMITPAGYVTTIATGLSSPYGVAVTPDGSNIIVAASGNHQIKVIPYAGGVAGTIYTLAGSGAVGSNDATGALATFNTPYSVAVTPNGSRIIVCDSYNCTIRSIDPSGYTTNSGIVTTLAGLGGSFSYANGTGTTARFNVPNGLAISKDNSIIVSEQNSRIRRITTSTFALNSGVASTLIDGSLAAIGLAVCGNGAIAATDYTTNSVVLIT